MNLHGIVAPYVAAVNPLVPIAVQFNVDYATAASGARSPVFATPGALVGSFSGDVLTVATVSQGKLLQGQALAGVGVLAGTTILSQTGGTPGGAGTYIVDKPQTVGSGPLTTSFSVPGQVQALTFRDLAQIEGLNLNGTRRAIYFNGALAGVMRWSKRGGDLVTLPDGSVFLVALVLEQWPDWCKVAVTQQDVAAQ